AGGAAEAAYRSEAARPRSALQHRERRTLGARPSRSAAGQRSIPRRRGGARGAGAVAPLRRRVLAALGAGGAVAAAVARPLARLPAAGKPRRNPRRPVRRRFFRRAIRLAGSRRLLTRDPAPAGRGPMGVFVGGGSAQSRRRPDPRPPPAGADRQPRRLPRRSSDRRFIRRRPAGSRGVGGRGLLGGGKTPRAVVGVGVARRADVT